MASPISTSINPNVGTYKQESKYILKNIFFEYLKLYNYKKLKGEKKY